MNLLIHNKLSGSYQLDFLVVRVLYIIYFLVSIIKTSKYNNASIYFMIL